MTRFQYFLSSIITLFTIIWIIFSKYVFYSINLEIDLSKQMINSDLKKIKINDLEWAKLTSPMNLKKLAEQYFPHMLSKYTNQSQKHIQNKP